MVRLLDGQTILAEKKLPSPGAEWKEYPLEFALDKTVENATPANRPERRGRGLG